MYNIQKGLDIKKKASSKSDEHHIPVQRSTTISGLSVIISLYLKTLDDFHCVKNGFIRSFSGPYFPVFGLNAERYRVSLRIQSECLNAGKYGSEKLRIWTLFMDTVFLPAVNQWVYEYLYETFIQSPGSLFSLQYSGSLYQSLSLLL